jgi:DNA-binding NarL/FixJ family response regulator
MRVVLADDAVLLREALAAALTAAGFDVVGQAGDVEGLLGVLAASQPEVAIIDVRMPPTRTTEGLDAAVRIRAERPEIGILILSSVIETRHVLGLLRDDPEGMGYLLKDRITDLGEFTEAVRRIGNGGSVVDPEVVSTLLGRARPRGPLDDLTPRERDVLELMAEGRSNLAIADRLGLTEKTVEGNVRVILSKLGLEPAAEDHRRVLAVLTYLRGAT